MHAPLFQGADMLQTHALHDLRQALAGSFRGNINAQHKPTLTLQMTSPCPDVDRRVGCNDILGAEPPRHFFNYLATNPPSAGQRPQVTHAAPQAHGQATRAYTRMRFHQYTRFLDALLLETTDFLNNVITP